MIYKKLKSFSIAAFLLCALLKAAHSQTEYGVAVSFSPNYSQPQSSESVFVVGFVPEYQPPAQVIDLTIRNVSTSTIVLGWTSTGENGLIGNINAGKYDLQYSQADTFLNYTEIIWSTNTAPGNIESRKVSGLSANTTYYFRLKTTDSNGNWADWSSVAVAHTLNSVASEYLSLSYQSATLSGSATNVYLTVVDTSLPSVAIAVSSAAEAGFGTFGAIYDVGPDGVVFAPPATARFSYVKPLPLGVSDETALNVYKYKNGTWQVLPKLRQNTIENWIEVEIDSLCVFAILYPDKEPPVTALSISGTIGQNGWYVSPANISLSSFDGVSGVKETLFSMDGSSAVVYASSFTVAAEGGHSLSFYSMDNALNKEPEQSFTFRIDVTTPAIIYARVPAANAAGWNNVPVSVIFAGTDAVSGIAYCSSSFTVAGEGEGIPVSGYCADYAGWASTASFTVSMDTTPPVLTYSADPAANDAGWNNSDVNVKFSCTDPLSGVGFCPGDVLLAGEGLNLQIATAAYDNAGNRSPAAISWIHIDRTAPVSTASLAGAYGNGWYSSPVTVVLVSTDALSGVKALSYSLDGGSVAVYAQPLVVSSEGRHILRYYAEDAAGNAEQPKTLQFGIDVSAPAMDYLALPAANAAGWNNGPVNLVFRGTDTLSGLESCSLATVTLEGAGQKVPGWCRDLAGNVAYSTAVVNIDLTGPLVVSSAAPAANASGWNNTEVTVSFSGTDAVAGVAYCSSAVVAVVESSSRVVTGYCADYAGNSSTASIVLNIDITPPMIALSSPAVSGGKLMAHFSVTDNLDPAPVVSAVLVETLDKGAPRGVAPSSVPVYNGQVVDPLSLDDGLWRLEVTAADAAGNSTQAVSGVFEVIHDTMAPVTTLAVGEPKFNNGIIFISSVTPLLLSATDDMLLAGDGLGSGVAATYLGLDGGTAALVTGAVFISSEGAHTLVWHSVDNAGNTEVSKTIALDVDFTPPVSEVVFSSATGGVLPAGAYVGFSAQDAGVGVAAVRYSVDGSSEAIFVSTFTLAAGQHSLAWYALDNIGNTEAAHSLVVQVAGGSTVTVREVTLSFEPSVLNLKSEGRYVEARLTVSSSVGGGFDEETIRITKVNGLAIARPLYALTDDNRGGCAKGWGRDKDKGKCYKKPKVYCATVKFDRQALAAVLPVNAVSVVTVEGSFDDDTAFTAEDYLRVINPGRIRKGHGGRWKHQGRACVDIGARALREDTDIDVMGLFERQADRLERDRKAQGKGFARRGEPFEFGPEGTVFDEPVEISLPYDSYDPKKEKLQVAYWNPSLKDWEPLTSTIDTTEKVVKAKVGHFSLYQVVASTAVGGRAFRAAGEQPDVEVQASGPSEAFILGEVYVYPNPAKGGAVPIFHIECGIADAVNIKVYTISGREAHETTLTAIPSIVDQRYAYEYAWRGHIPSGVYLYLIEARKGGQKIKKTGKFAVVR